MHLSYTFTIAPKHILVENGVLESDCFLLSIHYFKFTLFL